MHLNELRKILEPKRPLKEVGGYGLFLVCLGILVVITANGRSSAESDGETIFRFGAFVRWFLWYGLIAIGVFLVFAYPIHSFNPKVKKEHRKREEGAPPAIYEFDRKGLSKGAGSQFNCHICSGVSSVWSDLDDGKIPWFRLCEHCARELNLVKGVSSRIRWTEFPLARVALLSAGTLFLSALIHWPQPLYVLLRVLVCGSAAACLAFRFPSTKERNLRASDWPPPLEELEPLVWLLVMTVFNPFVPIHTTGSIWRVVDGVTALLFIVAASTTRRFFYGEFLCSEKNSLNFKNLSEL